MILDRATKITNLVTSPPIFTALGTRGISLEAHITQKDQDSQSAENHGVSLEDDAQYTNSSRGEDSEEEIGIPTNIHDPYFAELDDDDDYSADAELDPTNESIYESEEHIESASEDMECSSDVDSDATNQRDVDHTNIQDPNNTSIRDLFLSDFEVDYSSDKDFDAAAETANDSEENMEDSKDVDSDYTDDPNALILIILDLARQGDIDDRSSDEGYEPTDEGTDDDRDGSESDQENSEQKVGLSSFLSTLCSLTCVYNFRSGFLARHH